MLDALNHWKTHIIINIFILSDAEHFLFLESVIGLKCNVFPFIVYYKLINLDVTRIDKLLKTVVASITLKLHYAIKKKKNYQVQKDKKKKNPHNKQP